MEYLILMTYWVFENTIAHWKYEYIGCIMFQKSSEKCMIKSMFLFKSLNNLTQLQDAWTCCVSKHNNSYSKCGVTDAQVCLDITYRIIWGSYVLVTNRTYRSTIRKNETNRKFPRNDLLFFSAFAEENKFGFTIRASSKI